MVWNIFPLKASNQNNGVETLLSMLKNQPHEIGLTFQKRKHLHQLETMRRYRNLKSVGVDITAAYDTET